ncbi:hypothetical protein [Nocardia jiangsuensis]|uniref:Uncharacterized protein n=1 Tax=Nocardia jiangsuensis TaxID=1691563 RepID=A0ABV8E330_9NOCA
MIASGLATGSAEAAPLAPDHGQPANGSGLDPAQNRTPCFAPVQVPPVRVEESPEATDGRAVVIAPSGHCEFWVAEAAPVVPIRIDTPGFGLAGDLGLRG